MFTSLRYPTPKQNWIWSKRRQNIRPSEIAKVLQVSRPFISKEQRIAESRIKKLLQHAASINRIEIDHLSTRYGIATGYCRANQTETYILYSPAIGVQTWFTHTGTCGNCEESAKCENTLKTLAKEWDITVKEGLAPTDLAIYLFQTIIRRLKWEKNRRGK